MAKAKTKAKQARVRRTEDEKRALHEAVEQAKREGKTAKEVYEAFAADWGTSANSLAGMHRDYRARRNEQAHSGTWSVRSVPWASLSEDDLRALHAELRGEVARRKEAFAADVAARKKALDSLAEDLA